MRDVYWNFEQLGNKYNQNKHGGDKRSVGYIITSEYNKKCYLQKSFYFRNLNEDLHFAIYLLPNSRKLCISLR
jgi:hypothetical protein